MLILTTDRKKTSQACAFLQVFEQYYTVDPDPFPLCCSWVVWLPIGCFTSTVRGGCPEDVPIWNQDTGDSRFATR
eukprot:6145322-Amphidinium_carterae.1